MSKRPVLTLKHRPAAQTSAPESSSDITPVVRRRKMVVVNAQPQKQPKAPVRPLRPVRLMPAEDVIRVLTDCWPQLFNPELLLRLMRTGTQSEKQRNVRELRENDGARLHQPHAKPDGLTAVKNLAEVIEHYNGWYSHSALGYHSPQEYLRRRTGNRLSDKNYMEI